MSSLSSFWIELQTGYLIILHPEAHFSFYQCLDHKSNEEGEHVGLNPFCFLEEQRCGIVDTLELREPQGGRALRQLRILRLTEEAYHQGGLLT